MIEVRFGYITGEFFKEPIDVIWVFNRLNEEGEPEEFEGLATTRSFEGINAVEIGNNKDFKAWLNEHS